MRAGWLEVTLAIGVATGCGRIGYREAADGGLDAQAMMPSDAQVPRDAQVQDADVGPAPQCTSGTIRCVDEQAREICDAAGQWAPHDACLAVIERCEAGVCTCVDTTATCTGGVEHACGVDTTCPLGCGGNRCRLNTVATAGLITCDPEMGTYCSVPAEECYLAARMTGGVTGTCAAPGGNPPMLLTRIDCDGPGDCPLGQQCCHADYALCHYVCVPNGQCIDGGPTQCTGTIVGTPIVLCDPDASTCAPPLVCRRIPMAPPSPTTTPIDTFGCIPPA